MDKTSPKPLLAPACQVPRVLSAPDCLKWPQTDPSFTYFSSESSSYTNTALSKS